VLSDLKTFVLKYIYGDKSSTNAGEARARKWKSLKHKSTIRLPPDDDSLTCHMMRANYLSYIQHHYELKNHPSPLQQGWHLVDGKCRPIRYTKPALPLALVVASNTYSSYDSESDSYNDSDSTDCFDSDSSDEASSESNA